MRKIPKQIRKVLTKSRYSYEYIIIKKSKEPSINKPFYLDLNIFTILKYLYKNHKISRVDFKNSIKHITHNKLISDKVYNAIHYFLSSIKTNSSKNTMTSLNKQTARSRRFMLIKKGINQYSVYIKLKQYRKFMNNCLLNTDYSNIQKEFIMFMNKQNDRYFKNIYNLESDTQHIKNIGGDTKHKLTL